MNKSQEELERIIQEFEDIMNVFVMPKEDIPKLVQAILSTGYIHREDVELDEEKAVLILEEVRKKKCIICEYRYDKNGCMLHQIKNRDYCKRDLTDKEIIDALVQDKSWIKDIKKDE